MTKAKDKKVEVRRRTAFENESQLQAQCQRMRGDCKAVMFSGQRTGSKRWVLLPFVLAALLLASSLTADAQSTSIPGTAGELTCLQSHKEISHKRSHLGPNLKPHLRSVT